MTQVTRRGGRCLTDTVERSPVADGRNVADPADIAHLLRRTEFVVKPARLAELTALHSRGRPSTTCSTSRANGNPQLPANLTYHDDDNGWEQFVFAYDWWIDSMRTTAAPDAGEDDPVLARALHQLVVGRHRPRRPHDAPEPAVPDDGGRRLPVAHPGDGAGAGDARVPEQRRQPQGLAEPELRPRADGAVHPGRRQLHRGDVEAAARAWTGHNADWPNVPVPVLRQPPRQRQQDVLRHDEELERPGHHRRDPARQRRQAADRGAVHHQEAVGLLRLSGRAGERDQRARRCRSSPPT